MKRALQIANGVALVVTIIINYLSNTGIFNGNTMADVSARYQNYFTPAGYAFFIWGIIYLGLAGFVGYSARGLFTRVKEDGFILEIGWWFVVSCVANSLWILAWLYDFTGLSVLIMLVLLFSLLKIVVNTDMERRYDPLRKFVFVWWPFAVYSGWITVALIANAAAYLTKIKWDGFGMSAVAWTIIMICVAGAVNIFMIWNRNMREFAMAGAWALVAIAVSNRNGLRSVVLTAIIVAAIVVMNVMVHGYKHRKTAFRRT